MKIHQISVAYVPEQDRILGRFNTSDGEELRMWITRRLCIAFAPTLNQAVADLVANRAGAQSPVQDELAKRMLTDFQRADALKKGDFQTPYRNDNNTFPLGETPLIVTDVHISHTSEGALQMRFDERLEAQEPRGFQVVMENDLMHGFVHLFDKAVERAEWSLAAATQAKDQSTRSEDDTATNKTEKPTYLN